MIKKLLMIIGIVVLVLVLGFFSLVVYKLFTTKSDMSGSTSGSSQLFKTFSTDKYTFYYPATYVKVAPVSGADFTYNNPKTRAASPEVITFSMQNVPGGLPKANYQACQKFSEGFRQSSEDQISVSLAIGQKVGEGCMITVKTPVPNTSDNVTNIVKYLWYPSSKTDQNIYSARAEYFGVASADQASVLTASIEQFTLK